MMYRDTTPWLPTMWYGAYESGFLNNEKIIDDFPAQLYEQHIVEEPLDAKALFAHRIVHSNGYIWRLT